MEVTPKYQLKIDAMQKYVPFLNETIAKLKLEEPMTTTTKEVDDDASTKKLKQMELFYKFLQTPTAPSATFEELVECETVLAELYKNYEDTATNNEKVICSATNADINSQQVAHNTDDAANPTAIVTSSEIALNNIIIPKVIQNNETYENVQNFKEKNEDEMNCEHDENHEATKVNENTNCITVNQENNVKVGMENDTEGQKIHNEITTLMHKDEIAKHALETIATKATKDSAENSIAIIVQQPQLVEILDKAVEHQVQAQNGENINNKETIKEQLTTEKLEQLSTAIEKTEKLCSNVELMLKPNDDEQVANSDTLIESTTATKIVAEAVSVSVELSNTTSKIQNNAEQPTTPSASIKDFEQQNERKLQENGIQINGVTDHDDADDDDDDENNSNFIADIDDEIDDDNVELIKFSNDDDDDDDDDDDCSEEMILPDLEQPKLDETAMEVEETQNMSTCVDAICQNKHSEAELHNVAVASAVPEQNFLALDATVAVELNIQKAQGYDPLNCTKTIEDETTTAKVDEIEARISEKVVMVADDVAVESIKRKNNEYEDDDDEVQFIETHNSPICLDSNDDDDDDDDDDDANNDNDNVDKTELIAAVPEPAAAQKASSSSPAPIEVVQQQQVAAQRTSARKSTAKPMQQTQRDTQSEFHIVATIDLLESSDDDDNNNINNGVEVHVAKQIKSTTTANTNATATNANSNTKSVHVNKRRLLPEFKASKFSRTINEHNNKKSSNLLPPLPPLPPLIPLQSKFIKRAETTSNTQVPALVPFNIPTTKSNFLNAINLQPIFSNNCTNPMAFSAKLSDRNVIIPNAFYGNRQEVRQHNATITKQPSVLPPQRGRPRLVPISNGGSGGGDNSQLQISMERSNRRWLENFLRNFANPQQVATQDCFILLQRVLKHKMFMSLKEQRIILNERNTNNAIEQLENNIFLDLSNVFFCSNKEMSDLGRRFCYHANSIASAVTLTTERYSGRVTSRTRTAQELTLEREILLTSDTAAAVQQSRKNNQTNNFSGIFTTATTTIATMSAASTAAATSATTARKRQMEDAEYTPGKAISLSNSQEGDDASGERKKSLRTKRTRRYDNSFSYNEEELDDFADDIEPESNTFNSYDNKSYGAVQRKVEEKRLEAKLQREQQVKSFENAFIATVTQSQEDQAYRFSNALPETRTTSRRLRKQNLADNRKTCDLSTPTWIEPCEEDEAPLSTLLVSSAKDILRYENQSEEPREHRIYKVIPNNLVVTTNTKMKPKTRKAQIQTPQSQPQLPRTRGRPTKLKQQTKSSPVPPEPEIITCDDIDTDVNSNSNSYEDINRIMLRTSTTANAINASNQKPKNTDRNLHALSKNNENCVICNIRVSRIVHHYVNKHRGCETYTSRLSDSLAQRLRTGKVKVTAKVHWYKNGQMQFEAKCVFCRKPSRFMLPYWYQHYSMHTGEYTYSCSGCGLRKPTRSLMSSHMPCPQGGNVQQDLAYDVKVQKIEAYICGICNYVQLQRAHVVQHLRTEHEIPDVTQHKYIATIVLLNLCEEEPKVTNETLLQSSDYAAKTTMLGNDAFAANKRTQKSMAAGAAISTGMEMVSAGGGLGCVNTFYENNDTNTNNWNNDVGDPSDDLSFMICGMLDVEMRKD